MLVRLDLSLEDRWTTLLAGFDILHGPVTSAILAEAGHAASALGEDGAPQTLEARTVAITRFIARAVIRDWRGVVNDATGEPLPVTPETIDAVMQVFPVFVAFNEKVVDARIRIEHEKKDLPPLQNGTSGAGQATAPTAETGAPTARH